MRWRAVLPTLVLLVLGPTTVSSAEEARPVFLNWAQVLGVCGGRLLFYGEDKPRVYSGLYTYNGDRVTLLRDFYDLGQAKIRGTGLNSKQSPPWIGPQPLGHWKSGVQSFLTACATPKSVKVVERNSYPSFGSNTVIRNTQLVYGEVFKRKTELFSFAKNKVVSIGAAPSKRPAGDDEGQTFLYNTEKAVVFTVNDARTTRTTLWKTVPGAVAQLHDFAELVAAGLKNLYVGYGLETGFGKLAFIVSGEGSTGRPDSRYYFTDGVIVQQVPLAPFHNVREHYELTSQDGVLALVIDGSRSTLKCELKVISFATLTSQNITTALGPMPDRPWCLDFNARTSSGSLFFVHPENSKQLMRLNLTTLALNEVITADGSIRSLWSFKDRFYFSVTDEPRFDQLYVTDGTPAGTSPITFNSRPLRGVEMPTAVFYNGDIYVTGFTRTNGDNILDFGVYRFAA